MRLAGTLLPALLVVLGATPAVVKPAGASRAPTIVLDRADVRAGDRLVVTLTGWKAQTVTVSVCGNLAKRGSADCDLLGSEGASLATDGPTVVELVASIPPAPCPCVVRAASTTQSQIATAALVIAGAPVGPVVDPGVAGPLLAVSLTARAVPAGLIGSLRAALGGPTPYDVTVSVRNQSSATLGSVALAGSTGRSRSEGTSFAIPAPGPLGPGQTKRQVIRTTLPAPVLGRFIWEVTASGAGASVRAEDTTSVVPRGFVALSVILMADLAAISWRRAIRGRAAPATSRGRAGPQPLRRSGAAGREPGRPLPLR